MLKKRSGRILALIFIVLIVCIGVYGIVKGFRQTDSAAGADQSGVLTDNGDTDTDVIVETPEQDPVMLYFERMTQEEKVGQLFLARVPEENQIDDISQYHLGGYLIFGRDTSDETEESLREKIAAWQSASSVPMLIASDEEGGDVTRVSNIDTIDFASPASIYAEGGVEALGSDAASKAQILSSLGINLNLSPVADVTTDANSFIFDRTLELSGMDEAEAAQITAEAVSTIVTNTQSNGVAATLKHFPGYGANGDSHTDIIRDTRSLDHFESVDFVPFRAGIDAGVDCVLVTHNIIESMDPDQPASLSPAVHQALRETLGFDGVIVTDDFDMSGLADFADQDTAAVQTINAGTDLIISSSYASQMDAIQNALDSGEISQERFNQAVYHVLNLKYKLGLIS